MVKNFQRRYNKTNWKDSGYIFLTENQSYTYSELINLLEEPRKEGNAKIKQITDWYRYFDYDKHKTKFVIKEIYKEPKPQIIKPRHSKYINLTWFLLKSLLGKQGESTKTNLMQTIGFVTNDFIKEAFNLGIDDHAVSFVYSKINSKFTSNINSFENKEMMHYSKVLYGVKKRTGEVIELTPQEIEKYNELDLQAVTNTFKSDEFEAYKSVPSSNPKGIIIKEHHYQKYQKNLADIVKAETDFKKVFPLIRREISNSDFTYDTSEAEAIVNNNGSIEAVKQELNRRINESIYEAFERKIYNGKVFDDNTTEKIIKLIHLNDLNAACSYNEISDTAILDNYEDDLNYDNDEPEEDTPVLHNNQKSKDWNVHDCQKMPDGSNWYDDYFEHLRHKDICKLYKEARFRLNYADNI